MGRRFFMIFALLSLAHSAVKVKRIPSSRIRAISSFDFLAAFAAASISRETLLSSFNEGNGEEAGGKIVA